MEHIVTDLAIGDFVAFSYSPTDNTNEINKTPEESIIDLNKILITSKVLRELVIRYIKLLESIKNQLDSNTQNNQKKPKVVNQSANATEQATGVVGQLTSHDSTNPNSGGSDLCEVLKEYSNY